jgi:hypothetical protein
MGNNEPSALYIGVCKILPPVPKFFKKRRIHGFKLKLIVYKYNVHRLYWFIFTSTLVHFNNYLKRKLKCPFYGSLNMLPSQCIFENVE